MLTEMLPSLWFYLHKTVEKHKLNLTIQFRHSKDKETEIIIIQEVYINAAFPNPSARAPTLHILYVSLITYDICSIRS